MEKLRYSIFKPWNVVQLQREINFEYASSEFSFFNLLHTQSTNYQLRTMQQLPAEYRSKTPML